jgi:hypothetical protein
MIEMWAKSNAEVFVYTGLGGGERPRSLRHVHSRSFYELQAVDRECLGVIEERSSIAIDRLQR